MSWFTPPAQRIASWTQFTCRAHLALADHVHEFDAGNGCRSRSKRFKTEHWPHHSLDGTVGLFDDVIQIFDLTDFDVRLMFRVVTFERRRVGAALVDRNLLGNTVLTGTIRNSVYGLSG